MPAIPQQSIVAKNQAQDRQTQTQTQENPQIAVVKKGQGLYSVLKEAGYKFPPPGSYTHQQAKSVIALMVRLNSELKSNPNHLITGQKIRLPTQDQFTQALQPSTKGVDSFQKRPKQHEALDLKPPPTSNHLPPPDPKKPEANDIDEQKKDRQDTPTWEKHLGRKQYAHAIAALIDAPDISDEDRATGFRDIARAALANGPEGYPAATWAMNELHKMGALDEAFREPLKTIQEQYTTGDPKIPKETYDTASKLLRGLDTSTQDCESKTQGVQNWNSLLQEDKFAEAFEALSKQKGIRELQRAEGFEQIAQAAYRAGPEHYETAVRAMNELHERNLLDESFRKPLEAIEAAYYADYYSTEPRFGPGMNIPITVMLEALDETRTWDSFLGAEMFFDAFEALNKQGGIPECQREKGFERVAHAAYEAGPVHYETAVRAMDELHKRNLLDKSFREPLETIKAAYYEDSRSAEPKYGYPGGMDTAILHMLETLEKQFMEEVGARLTSTPPDFLDAYALVKDYTGDDKTKNLLLRQIVTSTAPIANSDEEARTALLKAVDYVDQNETLTKTEQDKDQWIKTLHNAAPVVDGTSAEAIRSLTAKILNAWRTQPQ